MLRLENFIVPWVYLLGAMIGSFLNVIIFRWPRGFSLKLPSRSVCYGCKRQLRWWENIPLISFLILRGRCQTCHISIGWRVIFVEFLTALLFGAVYHYFGLTLLTPLYWFFVASLVAISFIDLDFRIIPDELSIGGCCLGLLASAALPELQFFDSLLGAVVGGGGLWLVAFLYEKIRKLEGLGFGDVKLLAMIGAFLGLKGVLVSLIVGSLFGTIVGLIVMVAQKKDLKLAIPFGPFLALGALVFLFWGEYIYVPG